MTISKRGLLPLLVFTLLPHFAMACACGCGVFDVGTAAVLPNGTGGSVWTEYDFVQQNHNWSGAHSAPDTNNDDKEIRTNFYTLGAQYMFNREWGIRATVPYANRSFTTTDDGTGDIINPHQREIGDVRINGIYSGFSPNMSSGLTFGAKLPTGGYHTDGFDRDTAIGTGSTDALLGGYTMGYLPVKNYAWFANASLDQPVMTQSHYRPGTEVDAASGLYREGWKIGSKFSITPVLQVIASQRFHDSGFAADENNTGYTRFMASPGVEIGYGATKLYADVEVPFYQYMRGDQLASQEIFKVMLRRDF